MSAHNLKSILNYGHIMQALFERLMSFATTVLANCSMNTYYHKCENYYRSVYKILLWLQIENEVRVMAGGLILSDRIKERSTSIISYIFTFQTNEYRNKQRFTE